MFRIITRIPGAITAMFCVLIIPDMASTYGPREDAESTGL